MKIEKECPFCSATRIQKVYRGGTTSCRAPPRYNIYEAMHHGPTMAHNTLEEEEEEEERGGVCMCATCGDETRAHAANTPNTRGLYRIGGRQITLISASQYSYGAARERGRNVDLLVSGRGGRFLSHFLCGANRSDRGKWKVFFVDSIYICVYFLRANL